MSKYKNMISRNQFPVLSTKKSPWIIKIIMNIERVGCFNWVYSIFFKEFLGLPRFLKAYSVWKNPQNHRPKKGKTSPMYHLIENSDKNLSIWLNVWDVIRCRTGYQVYIPGLASHLQVIHCLPWPSSETSETETLLELSQCINGYGGAQHPYN